MNPLAILSALVCAGLAGGVGAQDHRGTQYGPIVGPSVACPAALVPVAPNGSFRFTWDQRDANGNLVPEGRYWFEARAWDPGFGRLRTEFFCLSIQGPTEPALIAVDVAQVGKTTPLRIDSPNDPGAIYLAVLSLSSNRPFSAFGLDTCLSLPIFVSPLINPSFSIRP